MKKQVFDYMEKHHMLCEGDIVIAGISGGADSVCLLQLLADYAKKVSIQIQAVHVEHGIRGEEALEDMRFVQKLCEKLNIPCTVYNFSVPKLAKKQKLSEEEAGRTVRYQAFRQELEKLGGKGKIAVAHNRNDQAETMLLNLIRGSGMTGLKGIAPVRGDVIRPLLEQERSAIERFLADIGQHYRTDSTNLSQEYTRNKIRHTVLPVLEQINGQALKNMEQACQRISEAQEYLNQVTIRAFQRMVRTEKDCLCIEIEKLNRTETYLQNEIVLKVLYQCAGSRKNIGKVHIDGVLSLLKKESGKQISLPYEMKAWRRYDEIVVKKEKKEEQEAKQFEVRIPTAGQYTIPNREEIFEVFLEKNHEKNKKNVNTEQKTYTKWLDYDKIEGDLVIRTRRSGDYFVMDDKGHRQSLKAFFINEKIPREQRDEILLLADGSHIVWIIGYRISFQYKIENDTKRVMKIQMDGGKKRE